MAMGPAACPGEMILAPRRKIFHMNTQAFVYPCACIINPMTDRYLRLEAVYEN